MINPSNKDLVRDLLEDNRRDFAMCEVLEEKARKLLAEHNYLIKSANTYNEIKRVADLGARVVGIYTLIRHIRKDIRKRLDEVDNLRGVVWH